MANTLIRTAQGAELFFDAVLKTEYNIEVEATEHPIQSGESVTDHSFVKPETVMLEVAFSDVMSEDAQHSMNMFNVLRELVMAREMVTLTTRHKIYTDMLVTALSVPDEIVSMFGLRAQITLQHLEIVTARIVRVMNKVSSGKKNVETPVEEVVEDLDDSEKTLLDQIANTLSVIGDVFATGGDGKPLVSLRVVEQNNDIDGTFYVTPFGGIYLPDNASDWLAKPENDDSHYVKGPSSAA